MPVVTLQVAAVAVLVSTVLGALLGLGLARLRFRGRGATEALLHIYGAIKFGGTPEINAISIVVAPMAVAILVAWRVGAFGAERGRPVVDRRAA